jgi:hypothetical protein
MDQNTRKMFQRGVEALRAGDRAMARRLLLQVAALAPEHQDTWLWLSDIARTRYERREYLERCVAQDPQSRAAQIARKKISKLEWELLVAEDDPLPSARSAPPPRTTQQHSSIVKMVALVGIVLVLIGSGIFMVWGSMSSQADISSSQMATDISALPSKSPQGAASATAMYPSPTNNQAVSAQTTAETPTTTASPATAPRETTPDTAEQPPTRLQEPSAVSRGLGVERSQWEASHGEPVQESGNMAAYGDDRYHVSFHANRIASLQEQWPPDEGVSLDEARILSQQLLPTDSEFIETFTVPGSQGTTIDIYRSDWLREHFSDWSGSEPGTFTVIYQATGNMIRVYDIQLGDVR